MSNKVYGYCAICGKYRELTFEHIPPKGAGNNSPSKIYALNDLLPANGRIIPSLAHIDTINAKYIDSQKGLGRKSLCAKCNNDTGSWYGDEYNAISNTAASLIRQGNNTLAKKVVVGVRTYPLKFIKQVLSMFCSAVPSLSNPCPIIRYFLLNRESHIECVNNLPFRVYAYLLEPGSQPKITGEISVLFKNGSVVSFVELDLPPLGFQLHSKYVNCGSTALDITNCLEYSYDEWTNTKVRVTFYRSEGVAPIIIANQASF